MAVMNGAEGCSQSELPKMEGTSQCFSELEKRKCTALGDTDGHVETIKRKPAEGGGRQRN